MTLERPLPLEALLAQADWVTALARALVTDPATADDVAQSTWVDVMQAERRSIVDPRAWLATIVRRKAARARRTAARRQDRERTAAEARTADAVPSAADLAARLATHRELVDAVLALDEPYRQTVVLRFFENLDLEAIGERMQSKHNTVRSRLQRGLQLLRERLDRSHGGRERWLPAVLVLGHRQMAIEAMGIGVASGVAITLTMKKIALGAAALVAALLFALPLLVPPASATPPSTIDGPAVVQANARMPASPEAVATAEPAVTPKRHESPERTVTPAVSTAQPMAGRRLVDRDGKALANVLLRARVPTTARWQGGDRGWISGGGKTIRIARDEEERLLRDPRFAEEFFAALPNPEEWRATVLGTRLPAREVRTDADGNFAFAERLVVDDTAIEVMDPLFVLVVPGETGRSPWVAGPATRVEGSVQDVEGKPIAEAFVTAMCPGADGPVEMHGQLATRSDDDGSFLVRRALGGGQLHVTCDGFEPAFVELTTDREQRCDVVLHRPGLRTRRFLDGTVAETSGQPISGASVWFGRQHTTTADDGRFTLAADDPRPQYALTIAAKGWALLQQDDFGAQILAGAPTQGLVFVLDKKPRRVRGVVLGSNGVPLAGALVGIVDPTLLDISFESVEARIGEWSGGVRTGPDGAFALDGLGERAYRLRAFDPNTGASSTSAPIRVAAGDVVLRMPLEVDRNVHGRVVAADGRPLGGATVEVAFCTYITKGGGTQMDSAPEVACDSGGRFALPALPYRDAWLCVRVDGAVHELVPVETLARPGEVVVQCTGSRWLQLVGSEHRVVRTIHLELVSGALVPAQGLRGNAVLGVQGSAPVLPIPVDARAVVVGHGTKDERRFELTSDCAVHLRVR